MDDLGVPTCLKHKNICTCSSIKKSNPKQPSCQKGYDEKRCEIQGGGQEMAVMVG